MKVAIQLHWFPRSPCYEKSRLECFKLVGEIRSWKLEKKGKASTKNALQTNAAEKAVVQLKTVSSFSMGKRKGRIACTAKTVQQNRSVGFFFFADYRPQPRGMVYAQ